MRILRPTDKRERHNARSRHTTARADAYDRRDNLVLACPACNIQKADQHILAFLLARPARAESLLDMEII